MANIKLGGTTALSESSGTVTIDGGVSYFPAGHIIQIVTNTSSIQHSHSSTTRTRVTNGPAVTITTKKVNSKILLHCSTQLYHGSCRVDFFRSGVGSSTTNLSGNASGIMAQGMSTTTWWEGFFQWVDAPAQAASTAITYDGVIWGTGGTAIYWGDTGKIQRIIAFEIAV